MLNTEAVNCPLTVLFKTETGLKSKLINGSTNNCCFQLYLNLISFFGHFYLLFRLFIPFSLLVTHFQMYLWNLFV